MASNGDHANNAGDIYLQITSPQPCPRNASRKWSSVWRPRLPRVGGRRRMRCRRKSFGEPQPQPAPRSCGASRRGSQRRNLHRHMALLPRSRQPTSTYRVIHGLAHVGRRPRRCASAATPQRSPLSRALCLSASEFRALLRRRVKMPKAAMLWINPGCLHMLTTIVVICMRLHAHPLDCGLKCRRGAL